MKILKIGGSVLTDKKGYRDPDGKAMYEAAAALAALWKKGVRDLVIIHGAGSFGHSLVLKYGIGDGINSEADKIGFADTHASCIDLSLLFTNGLIRAGVPAVSIPPAAIIRQKNKRISEFDTKIIELYLEKGFLPVLHGDMVPDSELGGSVCSGDQIVSYLGKKADLIVLATDVDGVIDEKGNIIPEITSANFKDISKHLKKKENDVTGSMKGKLEELLSIDAVSYIVNARHPERIEALLFGKPALSTKVKK